MKFFIKCDDATNICDKIQYEEASFFEKFLLTLHLLFCKICRGYSSKNRKLSNAIKSTKIKTLKTEEKQQMKECLKQEMSDN